jgi:hypothetical protein
MYAFYMNQQVNDACDGHLLHEVPVLYRPLIEVLVLRRFLGRTLEVGLVREHRHPRQRFDVLFVDAAVLRLVRVAWLQGGDDVLLPFLRYVVVLLHRWHVGRILWMHLGWRCLLLMRLMHLVDDIIIVEAL